MAEEVDIEYRLVWPNHEVYAEQVLPENIEVIEAAIHKELKKLGVPDSYWPHREARVVKRVLDIGVWEAPDKAEKKIPRGKP